jgi:hypothetical protein
LQTEESAPLQIRELPIKTLDFFPEYCALIHTRVKTRSFRLGDKKAKEFRPGDRVLLTSFCMPLTSVKITNVRLMKLNDIKKEDLTGTEFKTVQQLFDALKQIYIYDCRRVAHLAADFLVTIIDWEYET